ncbi:AraC family transcriptional regulator [Maribacter hydrothermalis]|uniref:Cupin n=1 Tax=Maribacter hydrothermalis TaxID=1836467 RepID=A0A1B7Z218_9FLAO|nr:AraC family transcriptional regulator [Maribacter hydrothermalis]APQ18350.1 AraC family transcriptional regulator [Maribacter hydrothermalis]OBR36696.1 cupin [Maribacter hydrothermalis]
MKVYPFKIPKPIDEHLIVQIDKEPIFYNRLHQHEEIQISCILNGTGKLLVGDSIHQFSTGDLFVIGSNLPHIFKSIQGETDAHMVTVFFTAKTFGEDFFKLPYFNELDIFFRKSIAGFKVISNTKNICEQLIKISSEQKLARFISFLKLIEHISLETTEPLSKFIYNKTLSTNEGERLQIVFDYVFKNFQNPIALAEVAKMAFMTPNAFCRFFKERTNKTFFEFLIELRIEHACQLLNFKKELNINLVSDRSGFNSISNFNKKFKKIKGITPTQYQQSVYI